MAVTSYTCKHKLSGGHKCGAVVKAKSDFKRHMLTHLPYHKRPHACDVKGCGARFNVNKDLLRHKNTHRLTAADAAKHDKHKAAQAVYRNNTRSQIADLKPLTLKDEKLCELVDSLMTLLTAKYGDAAVITMLSRSVHKDGDDRILAKKMSQELDALLTEAGYDCITTTGHHFVQGAYDPNNQGASDTSRAFISLPLKVLDYIKTKKRFCRDELADKFQRSNYTIKEWCRLYQDVIAKHAGIEWYTLKKNGRDYALTYLKGRLAGQSA